MSSFSFSTIVHGKLSDYTVKTMNFESLRRIIINVNDRDRVINTRDISYNPAIKDEELMSLVKQAHEERVESLKELMRISTKLEQKVELESNQKLGLVFLNNGMAQEALEEFRRALSVNSQNAPLLNHYGLAFMLQEKYTEAAEAFRRALTLKPNFPDLHNNLGLALFKIGRFDEAMREFEQALAIHPSYAEVHFNVALCELCRGIADNQLAPELKSDLMQHLSRAVELNSYYNNEYFKVAQTYLAKDQWNEARQALIEAKTSVSAQTGSEMYHEFYLRLKYGDEGVDRSSTERYIAKLEEILNKNPNYVDVHNDLGVAYLIQCRFLFNRAVNEFKRALAINPNYAKAQKNMKLAENEGKGFLILLRAILYF